jgi:hypothetical protein
MKENDIRWEQRFANYRKALALLQKFIDTIKGKAGKFTF